MHFNLASLAVSAVAVSFSLPVTAQLFPGQQLMQHRDLEARDVSYGLDPTCADALQSAGASLPTPPLAYLSYVDTASITATGNYLCTYTYPPAVASGLSSYTSAIMQWYSTHSDEWQSALSSCPANITDPVPDVCGTATKTGTGTGTATGTATATATSTATATGTATATATGTATATAATVQATNAGARETGAVAVAALAAVGVLGAVAAM